MSTPRSQSPLCVPSPTGRSRRQFLKTAAAGLASAPLLGIAAAQGQAVAEPKGEPPQVKATKSGSTVRLGGGDHVFEVEHDFLQLPDRYEWQITHNVAVDAEGRLYVIHEGEVSRPEHPAIFVFHPDGRFITAFGEQFQGGGHGLEVRTEGDEQFLYVTAYQGLKFFAKLTLEGEEVWRKYAPMDSGRYADGEAESPEKVWGRDRFMPTNYAFLSDGRMVVADGYGAWTLHVYAADGSYERSIGEPGNDEGQFKTPHGLWVDDRSGEELLCVADRANNRLQWLRPDGTHAETQDGFLLPANIDQQGDLLLVPELQARITLLGPDNAVVARLGDDEQWRKTVLAEKNKLRTQPDRWEAGRFVHPHDACFDGEGNILVAEWVKGGRVSRLNRI